MSDPHCATNGDWDDEPDELDAPEPADQTRADVVLTEAERRALNASVRAPQAIAPDMAMVYDAATKILGDRLAAERAEHAAALASAWDEGGRVTAEWESRCASNDPNDWPDHSTERPPANPYRAALDGER